jgi:hypothetical protein
MLTICSRILVIMIVFALWPLAGEARPFRGEDLCLYFR